MSETRSVYDPTPRPPFPHPATGMGPQPGFRLAFAPAPRCDACGGRKRKVGTIDYCPACKQREDLREERSILTALRNVGFVDWAFERATEDACDALDG